MKYSYTIALKTLYDFCENQKFEHPNMEVAKRLLTENKNNKESNPTIKDIKLDVYNYYINEIYQDLSIEKIESNSKNRERKFVEIRQVGMKICCNYKKIFGWSYKMISEEIGGKNHATVISAEKFVANHCDTEPEYRNRFEIIEKYIKYKYGL